MYSSIYLYMYIWCVCIYIYVHTIVLHIFIHVYQNVVEYIDSYRAFGALEPRDGGFKAHGFLPSPRT